MPPRRRRREEQETLAQRFVRLQKAQPYTAPVLLIGHVFYYTYPVPCPETRTYTWVNVMSDTTDDKEQHAAAALEAGQIDRLSILEASGKLNGSTLKTLFDGWVADAGKDDRHRYWDDWHHMPTILESLPTAIWACEMIRGREPWSGYAIDVQGDDITEWIHGLRDGLGLEKQAMFKHLNILRDWYKHGIKIGELSHNPVLAPADVYMDWVLGL
ncbi:hypothetical protein N9X87_00395 [bacterium]|nr:hypothetical protein [bacterium]